MKKANILKMQNEIFEFKIDADNIEIFDFPEARIIGKTLRCVLDDSRQNPVEGMWNIYDKGWRYELDDVPRLITNALIGCTYQYRASDKTYKYTVGIMSPKDTPVPEGFDYIDLPALLTVKGLLGEWLDETNQKLTEFGYHCGGGIWYNADLYVKGEKLFDENGNRVGRLLSQICDINIPV